MPRKLSIDPETIIPMDKAPAPAPGEDFNVLFIGAGNIMFGSDEGPWNHSFRLEHKLGPRLKVVALIDPWLERASQVLDAKRASFVRSAYEHTRTYKTLEDFVADMDEDEMPQAVWVGSPPEYRGSTDPGKDIELQLLKAFPGVALFIEKPVTTGGVDKALSVAKAIHDARVTCSVGYMLRYLKCVQKMKQIIEDNNLVVMATVARYVCAYERILKHHWWDKSKSGGPVLEQGTHFCDLSRYFGGEVDIPSVSAHSLEFYEPAGKLSKIGFDEEQIIPAEQRIPRVTAATWKYKSGAVGSFTHAVALQGRNYSCVLEVYADGYQMRLEDPYNNPSLYVRRPGDDHEETYRYGDDDPFFTEVANMIDVIEGGPDKAEILSSFEDAVRTYEFTWAIRRASEASRNLPPNFPKGA
ncbi:hypothetical protein CALVIDRAFT_499568 [Calocera viscosa TUFC12733]|uniref:Oxidoreductase C terminal-domain-containing protein n=1 Tax=Calocera viscosa (strain TUFC12733) TaxID=1330018 RepID=A0A167LK29_CALVF|nr:hypothetical protein CALVIDRAFT_499568 [Calocera viscosa TUFC12733]